MRGRGTDGPVVAQSRRAAVSNIRRVSNQLAFGNGLRRRYVHRERARRLRGWRQRPVVHHDAFHAAGGYFDITSPDRAVWKLDDNVVRAGFELKLAIVSERFAVRLAVDGQQQTTRVRHDLDNAVRGLFAFGENARRGRSDKE